MIMSTKWDRDNIYNASAHLKRLERAIPEASGMIVTPEDLDRVRDEISKTELSFRSDKAHFIREVSASLIQKKKQFSWQWTTLYINKVLSFGDLGRAWSALADATIAKALEAALLANGIITTDTGCADQTGIFLLALGKLGGNDLNYSSDVDIICFYDPEAVNHKSVHGLTYSVHNVLRDMTEILKPSHMTDYVWRVDWRLRPNASVSNLCHSTVFAQDFYFFKSQPWHRLALIKARPIAGDIDAAREFLHRVSPFIWRRSLDYTMIDELAQLKQRINREHPTLKLEKPGSVTTLDQIGGFDVKLGRGGIREIEFIVNAFQLIWGGRIVSLQNPNTLEALSALKTHELLESGTADRLKDCYVFLRKLENAIQMRDDAHTHIIPEEQGALSQVLTLMGEDDHASFRDKLRQTRECVHTAFKLHIDDAASDLSTFQADKPLPAHWLAQLEERGETVIAEWFDGFSSYNFRIRNQDKTEALARELIESAIMSGLDPNQAMVKIDTFLKRIKLSDQYIDLLCRYPALVQDIFVPLLTSPPTAILLNQSPQITDILIVSQYVREVDEGKHVPRMEGSVKFDFERALNSLRRDVNEGLFQTYTKFLKVESDIKATHSALTNLAEDTLRHALEIVGRELGETDPPLCILGQGKLGMSCMSPLSDLDLMFLFHDDVEDKLAHRYVTRLRTALSMPMQEGIAYELDMRLRPSGRSGPAAVTVTAFEGYNRVHAKNWEHIALIPARPIIGDTTLLKRLESILNQIVTRPRDRDQLNNDTRKMWHRIASERIVPSNTLWQTKLAQGGLLQAEFFVNKNLLELFPTLSALSTFGDYRARLSTLSKHNASFAKLPETLEFYWTLLIWERLLGLPNNKVEMIPQNYMRALFEHTDTSAIDDLKDKVQTAREYVIKTFAQDVNHSATTPIENWKEMPVRWV